MTSDVGDTKRGFTLVFTGEGKGKTTAALGSALRAVGRGLKVLMIQFIKGGQTYGELEAAGHVPGLEIRPMGRGLIGKSAKLERHRIAARQAWDSACREAGSGSWDMVILDEVFIALGRGFVQEAEVAGLIKSRPESLHLVLTGRGCPTSLYPLADVVTEMKPVKHHLQQGVPAQTGIEF